MNAANAPCTSIKISVIKRYKYNHCDVGEHCEKNLRTWETSKNGQIEEHQRCRDCPINVPRPIDLSDDNFCGMAFVRVMVVHDMIYPSLSCSHREVGQRGSEGDQNRNVVEETQVLCFSIGISDGLPFGYESSSMRK